MVKMLNFQVFIPCHFIRILSVFLFHLNSLCNLSTFQYVLCCILVLRSTTTSRDDIYKGKVQISILWTEDEFELSILNATHLGTQEDAYKSVDQDFWLIIRCLLIFFGFISSGAAIFCATENWAFSKGLWFLIVTTTTVGYGDIVPQTDAGKLFNCVFIMMSTVLLGWAFSVVMNYLMTLNLDHVNKVRNSNRSRRDSVSDAEDLLQRKARNLWITFAVLIITILFSSIYFSYIANEQWPYVDSLMFAIATMSTVCYMSCIRICCFDSDSDFNFDFDSNSNWIHVR